MDHCIWNSGCLRISCVNSIHFAARHQFCIRYPARLWLHPMVAPAAALAVCLTLYMFDSVLNAMVNPIFMLAAGGLATVSVQSKQDATAQLNGQMAVTS